MSTLRSSRVWAPGLALLVCMGGLALARVDPVEPAAEARQRRPPQMSDEGRALLGGLAVGERLMGWDVLSLDGPHDGVLRIELGRNDVRFSLMVATSESRPESPPVSTGRYAIFYGHAHPPEVTLPDGTIRATTNALARRIRANEGTVTVPGM